jgi:lipopolysaccharide transport system permease protein
MLPWKVFDAMKQLLMLLNDLQRSRSLWRFWTHLAWEDIARQYRRSFLGPIWITLNMGIFIVVFGLIGSQLFKTQAREYLPYLSIGHILFSYLSLVVNEGCQVFIQAGPYLKQAPFPKFAFIFRVVWRNLLMLAHNLPVMLLVVAFGTGMGAVRPLWLLLGVAVMVIFSVLVVAILGLVAARFRDVPMIATSVMQIAFFVTPVMWRPEQLSERSQWAVWLNPLAALLELVRAPLQGMAPSIHALVVSALAIAILLCICTVLYTVARRRIVYWI